MGRRIPYLFIMTFILPATYAQSRAPVGGAYGSNGHFYKGGQFMPAGSGGAGGLGPSLPEIDLSASMNAPNVESGGRQHKARLAARAKARTTYRAVSRGSTVDVADEVSIARSRIAIAKSLLNLGKIKDAVMWLNMVIRMKASAETVQEAQGLKDSVKAKMPSDIGITGKPAMHIQLHSLGVLRGASTEIKKTQIAHAVQSKVFGLSLHKADHT